MGSALSNALWITLIGMGLVFIAILMLWGMMALIVRLTAERAAPEQPEEEAAAEPPFEAAAVDSQANGTVLKQHAAAAAVAVAIAMQRSGTAKRSVGPANSVSAWQAVHRAGQMNQRLMSSRKKVVR